MKYIRSTFATAVALACASGGAWAQSAQQTNFVGPAIGFVMSSVQGTTDYRSSGVPSIDGRSMQATGTDVGVIASWGFAMSPDWVGTVGLTYGFGSQDMGTMSYTAGGAQSFTTKTKEHLSVSFAPGYRAGSNTLVYGKLAYHQMNSEYNDTFMGTGTLGHTGTGAGIGAAFALGRNVEMRAEYESVTYSQGDTKFTSGKPMQRAFTVGLLFKF